ncbi:MAG TPA: L,D-transpeptidase [Gemmatimonadaceae bacterium]|nr:L,D-transpeptidase [Gemmatimonadaceae bacterium]
MPNIRKVALPAVALLFLSIVGCASAQTSIPPEAMTAGRDTTPVATPTVTPVTLSADLGAHILSVRRGSTVLKTYSFASGQDRYPTPRGTFRIRKIVWNPSWTPPPDAAWAKGKTAKGPGDPRNPMKVVKVFFQEPDYYIHGTDDVNSLGQDASHGCLRMSPDEVADLAKLIMENGGQPRDENWFWRIIHSRREEKVVYLSNPISLTVAD